MSFESSDSDFHFFPLRCEVTAEDPIYIFAVDEAEKHHYDTHLVLYLATIQHDVKDEYNVLEVTACDYDGDEDTQTLAILERSSERIVCLDDFILFPPVMFRLRAGAGPVEIEAIVVRELREAVDPRSNEE